MNKLHKYLAAMRTRSAPRKSESAQIPPRRLRGQKGSEMYYFIKYEVGGKTYEATVQPHENPMYRLISLTDAGAKIVDIREQRA